MSERFSIQIKEEDNVAVAVHDLPAGTQLESGVVTRESVPRLIRSLYVIFLPAVRLFATVLS